MEGLFATFAELPWCSFDVLLGKCGGNILRDEAILRHHIGLQPDAHGIISGSECPGLPYTGNPLNLGDDVDFRIVLQKGLVVRRHLAVNGKHQEIGALALGYGDPGAGNFLRQKAGGAGYPVLHVHRGKIGVGTDLKEDTDGGCTFVGGGGSHVGHVLHPIDLLL